MALLRPSVWTQQPQQACEIDWSNPITRGMFTAILPTGSGAIELVRKSLSSKSGSPTYSVGVAGNSGSGGASAYTQFADQDSYDAVGPITLLALINGSSATLAGSYLSKGAFDAANVPYAFGRSNTSSLYLTRGGAGDFQRFITGNTIYVPDRLCAVGVTQNGVLGSGATATYYLDGVTPGAAAGGGMSNTVATANALPIRALGTAEQSYLALGWNRVLSNAEIKSLSDNPWQIFKPIPRRIFAPVSASGGATITTNLGTATASGLTATLTQASTLIATQGTATASGLSATLAQAFTLQANRGTATASGAQATIAQAATISANLGTATASGFAADVQSAGNVTISANIGIATASGRQANIGDSVTVSASRGTATAAGYTAALEIAFTLAANRGTAQATGKTATIYASDVISASMGQGIASGYAALIVAGEIYARAPSGSGPVLVTQNKSRPVQTHATRYSNTGGIRR